MALARRIPTRRTANFSTDARNPDKRSSRGARRQPQHAPQLGAALRLPDPEAHSRQPPQLRTGRVADAARRARPDGEHLLRDRAGPPAPIGAGDRRRAAGGAGELRRGRRRSGDRGKLGAAAAGAHRRGAAAAGDRRAGCRPRPRGRSWSSPLAGRWAGCTAPAASPPPPRGRPASYCSTQVVDRTPRQFTPRHSISPCAAPASAC